MDDEPLDVAQKRAFPTCLCSILRLRRHGIVQFDSLSRLARFWLILRDRMKKGDQSRW